ncbi:uncharacterized protein LOC122953741 [Acropora millepora]|uniref:uncharacterized protein LOC122953741 n=1 Tax=Acropora millepora TaxID=45264 RepID=UPI001CF5205A|nr:uncharacterized protein LOC122953741 [Acropora millepora]
MHSNTCELVSNAESSHWNTCEFITNTGVCTRILANQPRSNTCELMANMGSSLCKTSESVTNKGSLRLNTCKFITNTESAPEYFRIYHEYKAGKQVTLKEKEVHG